MGESKECPSYVFKFWGDTDPRQSFIEAAIQLLREVDLDGLEYHFIRFDMTDDEFRILADLVRVGLCLVVQDFGVLIITAITIDCYFDL